MTSFYSLIKININPLSGDNLTIGMICFDSFSYRVMFSSSKKKLAKKVIDDVQLIDFFEKQIIEKLKILNERLSENSLFNFESIINQDYFSYLSKYNNGILQFTKPTILNDEISDDKFKILFSNFVDKLEDKVSVVRDHNFNIRIKKNLLDKVEGKVHINQTFNSDIIPSLISDFKLDCIGLNGNFVGAKSLDLSQSKATVSTHLNGYVNIITHLSLKYKKDFSNNKFFLISDEPSDVKSNEFKIWEKLNKELLFDVIHSEQLDKITSIIDSTKASYFLGC